MKGAPTPSDFWAKLKTDDDGNIIEWHPLLNHSAEVAAVMEALLQRTILGRRLARLAGWKELSPAHIARLSALAAIHDAGKVNHGFQNRAFSQSAPTIGHVWPIIDVFNWDKPTKIIKPLGVLPMLEWFNQDPDLLARMLSATWGHHGRPVPKGNVKSSLYLWEKKEQQNPIEGLQKLGINIRRWFPNAYKNGKSFPGCPQVQHGFNGLLTLADWIGSDPEHFNFAEDHVDPMRRARARARQAINKLSLDVSTPRATLKQEVGFDKILADPTWDPHPIQKTVRNLPIHCEGSLTVLESDTGSGKTEAALARFMRLFQERLVDGMYFAVPTRTAAKQLYDRVVEVVKEIFPNKEKRPSVIQAVPGYIKADDIEAKRLPNYEVLWDEDVRHRGWAAEHPKRYLAGCIVVGTVDQVLLSTLQVNHAHMRAAALLRHFLVVDEVHASDAYMTHLMDKVLGHHLGSGGHALLMSATLGTTARIRLTNSNVQEVPPLDEAQNIEYPLVTHVGADRTKSKSWHASSVSDEKTVKPSLHTIAGNAQAIAELAVNEARKGARVLIIRNLVDECIDTQRALEAMVGTDSDFLFRVNGTPAPHHSRFAPDDRKRLDKAIETGFGKKTKMRSIIAVATQTVEQSLDIDADLLITDLCPIDVLLQRIGRLHRHKRNDFPRPDGFKTARFIVLTPEKRDLDTAITGDGSAWKGPHGLGTVYNDLRTVEATWQVLEDSSLKTWQIPKHNRMLVERATHQNRLHAIATSGGELWGKHETWILGTEQANKQAAGYVEIDRGLPFGQEGFPTKDMIAIKTRLGLDDYRVLLPDPIEGPFGEAISELAVSEWQVGSTPETEQAKAVVPTKGGFTFRFCEEVFCYNRWGLALESTDD